MPSIKNKIAALGLVILLAIPLVFSIVIMIQRKTLQIKSRLEFDIKKNETISLNKKNINWLKKEKEVLIDGQFFDVKCIKIVGDMVLLTGYFDCKEDKLVNKITHLFQQKDNSNSPINQTAVKFLYFPIFSTADKININLNWHYISNRYPFWGEALPLSPILFFTQPPKLYRGFFI